MGRLHTFARDAALFAIGLAGIYHEVAIVVYGRPIRPIFVGLFAAMIGVAAFLRARAQRRGLGLDDDVSMNPFDR